MKTLIKQSWLNNQISSLVWAVILGAIFTLTIASYPGEEGANNFVQALDNFPEALVSLLGDAALFGTIDGWLQMNLYSVFPLVFSIYSVIFMSNIVCREIDTRSIEYTLSLPIARWKMISSRFITFSLLSCLIVVIIYIFIALTIVGYDLTSNLESHALVMINSWAVNLGIAAVVLFISLVFSDYNKAIMAGIGFVFASYLVNMITQATSSKSSLKYLSLFHFYESDRILSERSLNVSYIFILITITIVLIISANIFFSKKEIKV